MKPCTKPEHCWDWVTPEDVLRFALASVYAARLRMEPADGEPFGEGVGAWANRSTFAEALRCEFAQRLNMHADRCGVAINDGGGVFRRVGRDSCKKQPNGP